METKPESAPASAIPTTQTEKSSEPRTLKDVVKKVCDRLDAMPPGPTPEEVEAKGREKDQRERRGGLDAFLKTVGKRYRGCTLGNFDADTPEQKKVLDGLKAYARNLPDEVEAGNGLVLYGPSGTGKDHLLVGMAANAIAVYGIGVVWINGLDLYGKLRDRIGTDESKERDVVNEYARPQILYISDPLPPFGTLTNFQASMLSRILDKRNRECRPTWVSVNVAGGKEADDRMGVALIDRLRHGATTAHCKWGSYRKGSRTL